MTYEATFPNLGAKQACTPARRTDHRAQTAKALGLTIPKSLLLLRAYEVIE